MRTVLRKVPIVLFLLLVFSGARVESQALFLGGGSGFFFVENPGSLYATPTTASAGFGIGWSRWQGELRLLTAPFLSTDNAFDDSLLLVAEASLARVIRLADYAFGDLLVLVSADGGGYLRSSVIGEQATARRPVVGGSVRGALRADSGWEYGLAVRYRALLDREVVHSVEPTLTLSYYLGDAGSRRE